MLQFVLGRAGSGKTDYLRKVLVDLSSADNRPLMMIVPEQYSFETEKAILHMAGAKRANHIDVLSFTRLADLYFRTQGPVGGKKLTDAGRRMMMDLAAEACADQLNVYGKSVKDGRISDIMLTAINEMKLCGITGGQLRDTAIKLTDQGLQDKLYEISLLYDTYDAMVSSTYLDSRDDLTRLAQALKANRFFAGRTVAIDSFEGFTAQELTVLAQIMQQAENVIVSLCTDNLALGQEHSLFALINRTKQQLSRLARENSVTILPDIVLREAPRFKNPALHLLEQEIFADEVPQTSENHDDIHLFCARDIFEETEFAAAEIRRLVMTQDMRYSDFSIICRAPEKYAGSLETTFSKRDIPCFISHPQRVDAEPLMRFVLCAFEAVTHGMDPEDIFDMLKTGISGLTAEEIAEIENYSYLWQLKGRDWRAPFTRHPQGFGREMTAHDSEALVRLNALRERILDPLNKLAERTAKGTGRQLAEAVYQLLVDFNMEQNLPRYCEALENANQPGLAEKQLRIWALLIEILEQMSAILGDSPIARERFYRLLREIIRGEDVSDIPQVLDSVMFGMPEQIRQTRPKVVFLLGAVQGDFPLIPKNSGVFSDAERQQLIDMALPLGDPLPKKMLEERYLAYSSAALPSHALYVCYPKTREGEETQPSEIVGGLLSIFPQLSQEHFDRTLLFANAYESAFSLMAEGFLHNNPTSAALRSLFDEKGDYQGRIAALERATDARPEKIENKALAREVFSEISYLSPTQIETFYRCRFRYFCQYGLAARERRTAEVDALQYGTIMHFLFERLLSKQELAVHELPIEELLQKISDLIDEYIEANMGGWQNISARERYRLKRMIQTAALLVRHVSEELAQSRFKPTGFEVKLGEQFPPLKIFTPEGNTITVGGTVDRMDIYQSDRGRFVRIIDYKTGVKNFRLSDVLYGMNIQMLVYLAALIENSDMQPAGILYTPLKLPSITASRTDEEEKLTKDRDKTLQMKGLILRDVEILTAMEANAAGRFIPAKLLKSGELSDSESVLNSTQFQAVLEYSKSLIATMADELYRGQVEARPVTVNQLGCDYCPYRSVCGKEYTQNDLETCNLKKLEVLASITAGEENSNGENEVDTGTAGRD